MANFWIPVCTIRSVTISRNVELSHIRIIELFQFKIIEPNRSLTLQSLVLNHVS